MIWHATFGAHSSDWASILVAKWDWGCCAIAWCLPSQRKYDLVLHVYYIYNKQHDTCVTWWHTLIVHCVEIGARSRPAFCPRSFFKFQMFSSVWKAVFRCLDVVRLHTRSFDPRCSLCCGKTAPVPDMSRDRKKQTQAKIYMSTFYLKTGRMQHSDVFLQPLRVFPSASGAEVWIIHDTNNYPSNRGFKMSS